MRSEKGQSLVEFALVVPLLLVLLFGIIDFGRVFHVYLTLDHAGREAARAASIGKDDLTVKTVAVNDASSINLTDDKISINPSPRSSGTDVTITITYKIDFLTPIIAQMVGPFDLKNKTVMRVE